VSGRVQRETNTDPWVFVCPALNSGKPEFNEKHQDPSVCTQHSASAVDAVHLMGKPGKRDVFPFSQPFSYPASLFKGKEETRRFCSMRVDFLFSPFVLVFGLPTPLPYTPWSTRSMATRLAWLGGETDKTRRQACMCGYIKQGTNILRRIAKPTNYYTLSSLFFAQYTLVLQRSTFFFHHYMN